MDETQRAEQNKLEWEDYYTWLDGEMELGAYARNRKRQKQLIDYAVPYRLNVITDDQKYMLQLDDAPSGQRAQVQIQRYLVDGANSPETVIEGYIDQMRRDLERKINVNRSKIDSTFVSELEKYAAPFELKVEMRYSVEALATGVELTIKMVPEYGFQTSKFSLPDTLTYQEAMVMCAQSIDAMRTAVGWHTVEAEQKMAQLTKPFVLECPDHGGQMVPAEEDVFVCLVPGCKKRARRKYKHHVSGGMAQPPAPESSTAGSAGDVFSDQIQGRPFFQDAHGNMWQHGGIVSG